MAIKWRKELSTGLEWQDQQHQQILTRIDLLLEAMHVNKGDTVVADLLKFLHEYAQYHFSEEEKHMLESRCPIYEEHKRAHEEFVKNLMELQALYDRLGASTIVVMHLQRWLIDWLIEHIIHVDKQMAAEVRHD